MTAPAIERAIDPPYVCPFCQMEPLVVAGRVEAACVHLVASFAEPAFTVLYSADPD